MRALSLTAAALALALAGAATLAVTAPSAEPARPPAANSQEGMATPPAEPRTARDSDGCRAAHWPNVPSRCLVGVTAESRDRTVRVISSIHVRR